MQTPSRKLERLVLIGLTLVIIIIGIAFVRSRLMGPQLPVVGQVIDFALTNQDGRTVTLKDLRGEVWIADIIFTQCPAQCLRMTKNMAVLQSQLPGVKFVSLTADPGYDTPAVLKAYAKRYKAGDGWMFLTGQKKDVYQLAMDGLLLSAEEVKPEERTSINDLFIHSTKFMLVDKRGRLRGSVDKDKNLTVGFDGDSPDSNAAIIAAAKKLLRE